MTFSTTLGRSLTGVFLQLRRQWRSAADRQTDTHTHTHTRYCLSFVIGLKEGRKRRERESDKPTILGQFSRADLSLNEEVVFGDEEVGGEEVRSSWVVDTGQRGVLEGTTRRLTELHHMDRGRETDRLSRKRERGGSWLP